MSNKEIVRTIEEAATLVFLVAVFVFILIVGGQS
jgi:hypothetical protein